jgi:hypothetical protein
MSIQVYHATNPTFGFGPALAFPDDYHHVARVELPDDEYPLVFQLTNHIDHAWQENPRVTPVGSAVEGARSTSVGDVIVLSDGSTLRCESFGWTPLSSPAEGGGDTLDPGTIENAPTLFEWRGRGVCAGIAPPAAPDCSWCGGEASPVFRNRADEVFCSPSHRSSSNRALRRLQDQRRTLR